MFLTTRALVLREVRYKESDKILTVLSEDEGKLTVKARGALRPKGKLAAATQLLTFSELTLFGHKGFWTLNEAVVVEEFRGLRQDIERLALASYIAEALEAVSDEDSPEPAALRLGLNSLYALSSGLCAPELIKAAFELRLMCLSGYQPELSACSGCGKEVSMGWLSPADGELYCESCKKPGALEVRPEVLEAMRYIIDAEPKRVFSFTLPEDALTRLGRVCEAYALAELDRRFDSLEYYKRIRKTK